MEIEDTNQPGGNGSSGDDRPHERRPQNAGRAGDRPRNSRERASAGGDRRGSDRGRRERSARGGDRPEGRRSGPRDREPQKASSVAPAVANSSSAKQGQPPADLGGDLLASVSRSFSLTIRLLPDPLREPITLGYLLARALDTVADTATVAPATRLEHLRVLLEMIKYGPDLEALRPLQRDMVGKQEHEGERDLLKQLDRCLGWLEAQPTEDCWDLRRTLARIGRGQELDLLRFGEGTADAPKALETVADLDEYTSFVAGCVGELWTRLCQRHLPVGWSKLDESKMSALGKQFGQGLQMVNVLRDLPEDLANGRCYLPADLLMEQGIKVADLRGAPQKARSLLNQLRQKTLDHLDAAWEYVLAVKSSKLRYACALPVLIGLETLGLLAKTSPLETNERLKVSRASVKKLMASATIGVAFSPWLNRLHRKLRARAAGR